MSATNDLRAMRPHGAKKSCPDCVDRNELRCQKYPATFKGKTLQRPTPRLGEDILTQAARRQAHFPKVLSDRQHLELDNVKGTPVWRVRLCETGLAPMHNSMGVHTKLMNYCQDLMCPQKVRGKIRKLDKDRAIQQGVIADQSAAIANAKAQLARLGHGAGVQETALEKVQRGGERSAFEKQLSKHQKKHTKAEERLANLNVQLEEYKTTHPNVKRWCDFKRRTQLDRLCTGRPQKDGTKKLSLQGKGVTRWLEVRDDCVQTLTAGGLGERAPVIKNVLDLEHKRHLLWRRSTLTIEGRIESLKAVTDQVEDAVRADDELRDLLVKVPKWHIGATHIVDFGEAHGTVGLYSEAVFFFYTQM